MAARAVTRAVSAGRHEVRIRRPDKPLFPDGTTKADLAGYYERVAGTMLPHLAGRPLNLERYPDGIDGERIVQQRAGRYFPDWIRRVAVSREEAGQVEHVVAEEPATLVYLAGQACITLHPWLSRADRLDRPDRMVIDLDPADQPDTPTSPDDLRQVASGLGELLRDLGLLPFVMTTGSRGYHLVVPLRRGAGFETVRGFTRDVARVAVARDPRRLTIEQRKAARHGRIYLDVQRNAYAHTSVAPYAVRARTGAPVATPLTWEELADPAIRPDGWTLRSLPDRLERTGDPWRDIHAHAHPLGPARHRLDALLTDI
ncbi:non-homologous end-joining DNA ligase [Protofrankia coriariae]|uniref:DNA ligase D polymerase domain-containing protein n=1 Tax=Protofrankia coriariae TaxID=1562887 RepID=A0ABR5F1T3_9ACTN|nr:non-homologous end-joining DNA ligase [Protofrankia coriariae]KLL10648.1 hypothetical protein FrCorBMG51_16875 [Protofrankia coriariae]